METLLTWIRAPIKPNEKNLAPEHAPIVRLKFLLQLLDRHEEWKSYVSQVWASFFHKTHGFNLFTYVGLPEGKGFVDQVTDLMVERILPLSKEEDDLSGLITRLFLYESDADWLSLLPEPLLQDIRLLIESASPQGNQIWKPLLIDLIEATTVVSIQIAAMGTSQSLWSRMNIESPSYLEFIRLQDEVRILADHLRGGQWSLAVLGPCFADIQKRIALSSHLLGQVFQFLEKTGVNMGLIFRMQHQMLLLARLQVLIDCLQAVANGQSMTGLRLILSELIHASTRNRSISSLMQGNLQLLALRVVEHAGNSGEHYITRNRTEYWQMLRSAAGGGILTVGTSWLKFWISRLKAPPFIEALAQWMNFSGSFLLMQAFHFTLATKQPSMTASALAKKLSQGKGPDQGLGLASEIRLIVRSQLAAAAGNIGLAIPTAFLFAWLLMQWQDKPPFPLNFASYTLASLHPLQSLTLLYAAMTGVLLWASSIVAGWVENWVAFQRIPERLQSNHRIRRVFGAKAGGSCAAFLTRNISGIAGNIALGFLLAMLPFLGRIMGLPLDVRHVTLSSAQLAIAVYSGLDHHSASAIAWAVSGIIGTGLLNFGVSFWLALSVATRAQQIRRSVKRAVFRQLIHLFRTQTLSFFLPTQSNKDESKARS
jgi:site-specific recombinase